MKALAQFFQDDVGAYSCTRLLSFIVVAVELSVWIWGNIQAGQYVPMGTANAGIISAAILGKVANSQIEYGGGSK